MSAEIFALFMAIGVTSLSFLTMKKLQKVMPKRYKIVSRSFSDVIKKD
jgi:hypothetical protein